MKAFFLYELPDIPDMCTIRFTKAFLAGLTQVGFLNKRLKASQIDITKMRRSRFLNKKLLKVLKTELVNLTNTYYLAKLPKFVKSIIERRENIVLCSFFSNFKNKNYSISCSYSI